MILFLKNHTDIVSIKYGTFQNFIEGRFNFDLAHIDVSNTGDTIENIYK